MQQYLRDELERLAGRPSGREWLARVRESKAGAGTQFRPEEILGHRDRPGAGEEPSSVRGCCVARPGSCSSYLPEQRPGADPGGSPATRRMAQAGALVGLELVDHLDVGAGGPWVSLGERRGW